MSVEPAEPRGHVEVAFDITELGAGERVEILAATPNVTAAAQKRIVELIEHSLFRPRAVGGRFETSRVVVRYFVGEESG